MPEIRTLRPDERLALLELLDGWQLGDGWRGRDFFRRYVDDDPTFEERNVWVAVERDELVACVQVFPRRMRTMLGEQSVGGIGSVFTRPERRGEGIAAALLTATVDDLSRRGFALSLLFAERVAWYRHLGWLPWCAEGLQLVPAAHPGSDSTPGEDLEIRSMEPEIDLADVAAAHDLYSRTLLGTLIRDSKLWQASLRCAGNPDEVFLVARKEGCLVAYLRAIVLDGETTLTEWAVAKREEATLVALVDRVACHPAMASPLHLPRAVDALLERAFVRSGYVLRSEPRLVAMMRPLHPTGRGPSPPPAEVLESFVPRDRFVFWLADRF